MYEAVSNLRSITFISHLSRFRTITAERNVITTYSYVHNLEKKTMIVNFVYKMAQFTRFKMATVRNISRFPDFMLSRSCVEVVIGLGMLKLALDL